MNKLQRTDADRLLKAVDGILLTSEQDEHVDTGDALDLLVNTRQLLRQLLSVPQPGPTDATEGLMAALVEAVFDSECRPVFNDPHRSSVYRIKIDGLGDSFIQVYEEPSGYLVLYEPLDAKGTDGIGTWLRALTVVFGDRAEDMAETVLMDAINATVKKIDRC